MTPKSFPEKTDLTLVRGVKQKGDDDSFKEVCRRYENVFYKICQRYAPVLRNSGINPQDIFDDKNIIILNCIKSFDPKKGAKLSTHIGNYARYLCLNSISARRLIMPSSDE